MNWYCFGSGGSGKTTLLTLIAGLLRPSEEYKKLFRNPLSPYSKSELQKLRAQKIGFIFQTFRLMHLHPQNIELVMKFNSKPKREARKTSTASSEGSEN
ncbi:MAG: ATP-binding cassette domain-containing protein [Ignavibacteria bacterium]